LILFLAIIEATEDVFSDKPRNPIFEALDALKSLLDLIDLIIAVGHFELICAERRQKQRQKQIENLISEQKRKSES
jgi:hypothetical protein